MSAQTQVEIKTHSTHARQEGHSSTASAAAPKGKVWWKSKRAKTAGWVTLALSVVGLLIWLFFFHPYVSTDDARVAATLVRVAPEGVGGRVIAVRVTEGDRVKKGDILVEIDHRTTEAQVQKAKARSEQAAREFKRISQLAAQNGVAARELDQARSNADAAEADYTLAQVNFENTTLRSPVDGVVVQKPVEIGNILEPGQTAVTVADIDQAWIAANVEETSAGLLKLGQPVKVSIDEGGDLTGHVSEIRYATAAQFSLIPAENPSGNFTKLVQRIPIKVALDPHPDRPLRAGQSVEIKVRVR